jgi:tRNA/rRNA methyltransferase
MTSRVRFVLVEPREGGNVGAAARAMKNFGFTEMVIVGEAPSLEGAAQWWASGAEDVVLAARREPSLDRALADAHAAIATSSSRERSLEQPLTPGDVAALRASLGDDQTLALVFGREDRGLTAGEIERCGRSAVIPTSDLHPTMNLAQAIAIFAWELWSATVAATSPERELAALESVGRLHDAARLLLLDAGFLDETNPERIYADIRAIAARSMLDEREVTILLGIIRQMRWAMRGRQPHSPE